MLKIGIIVGSTRPGRKAAVVAEWVHNLLKSRKDAEFEVVDIEDYKLPLLDEPVPPSMNQYSKAHTKHWSAKIASFDAYIFVTPEYNHGTSAALKNDRFSVPRMEQRGCRICQLWQCGRSPRSGESATGNGRAQGCRRARASDAFVICRLRELHNLQTA